MGQKTEGVKSESVNVAEDEQLLMGVILGGHGKVTVCEERGCECDAETCVCVK